MVLLPLLPVGVAAQGVPASVGQRLAAPVGQGPVPAVLLLRQGDVDPSGSGEAVLPGGVSLRVASLSS